ncbi:MAG: hypothetical protein V1681_01035 [Candidatus Neomarinimicrobiota bacterium]
MNNRLLFRDGIIRLLLVGIFCVPTILPGAVDSLAVYQSRYEKQLEKLTALDQSYSQQNSQIATLDVRISELSANRKQSWIEKRKLSRLTAQKAEINDDIVRIFSEISALEIPLNSTFNQYYSRLSFSIDQTLEKYSRTTDVRQRQDLSRILFELVDQRTWLITTRRQFLKNDQNTIPEKENLVALLTKYDRNDQIKKDVINVLNDKISQIDQMIVAARGESQLRKRLNQLTTEMSSLTGDVRAYQATTANRSTGENSDIDGIGSWTNNPATTFDDPGYRNLSEKAALPVTTQPATAADYLPLFQKIATNELPLHMTRLDSLRQYYLKQLQAINGNK